MISPDIKELLVKTFHLFDFDGNGVIEKEDFIALAKKNAELTGGSTADIRNEMYYRTNIHLWNQIENHVDEEYGAEIPGRIFDGKITPDQWYLFWIDRIHDDNPDEVALNWSTLIFDLIDKDASGQIDPQEYQEFLELYNFPNIPTVVDEVFSLVDTDRNNLISKEEMVTNIGLFFAKIKENMVI